MSLLFYRLRREREERASRDAREEPAKVEADPVPSPGLVATSAEASRDRRPRRR